MAGQTWDPTRFRNHGEEIDAALRELRDGEVFALEPQGHDDPLGQLYRESEPVPGCAGQRVDRQGRRWYSAAWLVLVLGLALVPAGSARTLPKPTPLKCVPAKPPGGQFSPGNRNPNSPAGVLWINRHCRP